MSESGRTENPGWFVGVIAVLVLTGIFVWVSIFRVPAEFPDRMPEPDPAIRAAGGTCVDCHTEIQGFSPFHNPAVIGCSSCHLGNPSDTSETGSHMGMMSVPGNLQTAEVTCGQEVCHPDIVNRVRHSMMATGRGIVAVDRFAFGEQDTPNDTDGFADLGDSHADTHLKQMCISCHLGYEKAEPAPISELSRGGGCNACHIQYYDEENAGMHPRLTIQVTDNHCFGCHSRSGRISLNYQGWHETLRRNEDVSRDSTLRLLMDGRIVVKQEEDVHHKLKLSCIDCHTARETMGDGQLYQHQHEALEITCTTCHSSTPPRTSPWKELDEETKKIVFIRSGTSYPERLYVTAEKSGKALSNVFLDERGRTVLEGKLNRKHYELTPPADECSREGHERVSCQSCHSAWVPQCIGCHTQLDLEGQWREFVSDFLADPPTLGVREGPSSPSQIEPFVPGMIMTLNQNRRDISTDVSVLAAEGSFHRLFAPSVPHTTSPQGRTCESCHNDPLAVGFGRGELTLGSDPSAWSFDPVYDLERDSLPADAWIPFLKTRSGRLATRTNVRPFNLFEQERILRVGACLTCHKATPENEIRIYRDFGSALKRLSNFCKTILVER